MSEIIPSSIGADLSVSWPILSQRVKAFRVASGLSYGELQAKGVMFEEIRDAEDYEKSRKPFTSEFLIRLSKALNVPFSDIVCDSIIVKGDDPDNYTVTRLDVSEAIA